MLDVCWCQEGVLVLQWLRLVVFTGRHFSSCAGFCRDGKYIYIYIFDGVWLQTRGGVFGLHVRPWCWASFLVEYMAVSQLMSSPLFICMNSCSCPLFPLRVWGDCVWCCSPSLSQTHYAMFLFCLVGTSALTCLLSLEASSPEVGQSAQVHLCPQTHVVLPQEGHCFTPVIRSARIW